MVTGAVPAVPDISGGRQAYKGAAQTRTSIADSWNNQFRTRAKPSFSNTLCTTNYLFQPMFDEYFNFPPSIVSLVPAVVALEPVDLTCTPSSTSIDQDEPSLSTSQTHQES
ncbi:hypothetical protein Tco_1005247 [Tanacetum coccineum]|uniref:Uncharacterized protein n=1 Tax=Tanacetum coccineum TaxID=301880 RepID=A0ABQ5FFE0_9ASTR